MPSLRSKSCFRYERSDQAGVFLRRESLIRAEGPSAETPLLWEGRTEYHAPEIDGKVYINDFGPLPSLSPGRFYRALVTEAHDYDLVARILAPEN